MNLKARVRVVVEVPFDFDVATLNEYPAPLKGRRFTELNPDEKRELAQEREAHAKHAKEVDQARANAAKHAETVIAAKVAKALGDQGKVVDSLVEEVSQP